MPQYHDLIKVESLFYKKVFEIHGLSRVRSGWRLGCGEGLSKIVQGHHQALTKELLQNES
jgi:hypothetical protein